MTTYDPQSRRARSRPATASPVDNLLGDAADPTDEPIAASHDEPITDEPAPTDEPTTDDQVEVDDSTPERPDGEVRPFETPPVERTDEHADRMHRLGVLAAVAAALLVLLAFRRRRRSR